MKPIDRLLVHSLILIFCTQYSDTYAAVRIQEWTRNLLVDAKVTGNLKSYQKGLRGAADHIIYDLQHRRFVKSSEWHEYGVGFGQDLGVVPENRPAWWMAQWPQPIEANLIVLSGVYDNQPQPDTAWKIELRSDGKWLTHARDVGGWYDRGTYTWGGPATKSLRFDAIRVSVFSKDSKTPIKSIHFCGREGISWIVAYCQPIDVEVKLPRRPTRAGTPVRFDATPLLGKIRSWSWNFGDGEEAAGKNVTHVFDRTGTFEVALEFSDGKNTGKLRRTITVAPPIQARITPLTGPVMVGKPINFAADGSVGRITDYQWDFGDGKTGQGRQIRYDYDRAGIYKVKLTVSDGKYEVDCLAIVRAHTDQTLHVPQVFLDTDQKNEQDDQHYFGYALFSELDILGTNSVHHGGGQEPINYEEILNILNLAKKSGLPEHRVPFVFRGANQPLKMPGSGDWRDTRPIITQASEAILAAARGASPTNPVWIVPVGPGTNVASAILQARADDLELKDRMRVMWLGGSNNEITNEFNGNNDPWSMFVVTHSGLETWIMPAPVGARVRIDKRSEGHLYADHPLGQYLKKITPAHNKPLFDPSCLSAIISKRLRLGWIKQTQPVLVAGPQKDYRWSITDGPTSVLIIRQIDEKAMQLDIFNTMKGKKRQLIGAPVN